jgi:hypothetical protein
MVERRSTYLDIGDLREGTQQLPLLTDRVPGGTSFCESVFICTGGNGGNGGDHRGLSELPRDLQCPPSGFQDLSSGQYEPRRRPPTGMKYAAANAHFLAPW